MNIQAELKAGMPEMAQWRRHLHQHPELSFQEIQTSAFVASRLQEMGLEVRTGVGGYGVTAKLKTGKPGPVVALRADLDALPIQDEKSCCYASTVPGVMHACGHDAHTAGLLGVAKVLTSHKNEIRGEIVFLFQPAEEVSPGGALPMIADGALNGVDVIYGVHLWSPFPVGTVLSRAGAMWAAADEFTIKVRGKGGHGGMPHETVDSIVTASQIVVQLQTIVSRKISPVTPGVVSVGSIHGGAGFNVIAETCELIGTVRTFDTSVRDEIRRLIEQIAVHSCEMNGASCDVSYKEGYPPLINDRTETERFFRVAGSLFAGEKVLEAPLMMPGEDFAYYLQKIPGCFIIIGAGNRDAGITVPHHHPRFDIDEESMYNAALLLTSMALDYLRE